VVEGETPHSAKSLIEVIIMVRGRALMVLPLQVAGSRKALGIGGYKLVLMMYVECMNSGQWADDRPTLS